MATASQPLRAGASTHPAPAGKRRSGYLLPFLLFLGCAVVGFGVAASVRGNDDDGERVTLEKGQHGGRSYRIDGILDEQGERCLELLRDGDLNTGGCDTTANEALVGDMSVIFGQVPARAVSVRVPLTNGDQASAEVQERDGFRWYSIAVDQEIDVADDASFIDADGGSD